MQNKSDNTLLQQEFFHSFLHKLTNYVATLKLQTFLLDRNTNSKHSRELRSKTEAIEQVVMNAKLFLDSINNSFAKQDVINVSDCIAKIIINHHLHRGPNVEIIFENMVQNPFIKGDRKNLVRGLDQIIKNAVAYTLEGFIAIRITSAENLDNNQLIIEITDSGIGIQEHDLPFIFHPFYRTQRAWSQNASGSGLGLTISQIIFEKMGADLSLTSNLNVGTTVRISLPAM